MSFIAAYWFIWLLGFVACGGYALYVQVAFVKRGFTDPNFLLNNAIGIASGKQPSFFSHMGKVAVAGALSSVFGIVLAISVVIHIIEYVKA